MTQNHNEPPPASPGSAAPDDAPLRAFAARWATEALRTSHVPLSRQDTVELMLDIAYSMAAAVTTDEPTFTTNSALHAATRLIGAHFTGAEALGCSVRLLTTDLLGCAGLPDTKSGRDRVGRLCERLAVEYTEALRERLLAEQEMITLAVFAAERSRSDTEARLTAMFNASAMGIGIADLSLRVVETNPALEAILGYSSAALRGRGVYDFIDPLDRPRLRALFADLIRGDIDKFTDDSRWLHSDGEPVWIHLTVSLVRDSRGAPDYPVAMLENASEENLLRRQLHHQVIHDDLTGLANSSKFNTRLESLLASAEQGDRLALCYLDLDGFKVINDGVGKDAGDSMLRHVAGTLENVFNPVDGLVARMAGDGFAVLISNPSSPTAVTALVEEALTRLGEPVYFEEKGVAVSASVGIVEHAATDTSANYLVTAAEITTHRAKLHGKAQWMLFEPGLDELDRRRFQLAAVMPGALENGEFVIRYQPVIRLADRSVTSVRSLLRWQHPEFGTLGPDSFAEMAEETGLIVPLGRWVLQEVCQQAAAWRQVLGPATPTVTIAMSARNANDQYLVRDAKNALRDHGLDPSALAVVMPASVLSDPDGDAAESLTVLADLGIMATAAGFGGGNTNLVDLRQLPLQGVSVSGAVSAALAEPDARHSTFERAITDLVSLAHGMGLDVAAGGIDSTDVLHRMSALHVDLGFGDALAVDGTAYDIEQLLGGGTNH